jgi:hypothetical protein
MSSDQLFKTHMFYLLSIFISAYKHPRGSQLRAFANIIGPTNNRLDTRPYLSLPFCHSPNSVLSQRSLADTFLGNYRDDIGIVFS